MGQVLAKQLDPCQAAQCRKLPFLSPNPRETIKLLNSTSLGITLIEHTLNLVVGCQPNMDFAFEASPCKYSWTKINIEMKWQGVVHYKSETCGLGVRYRVVIMVR